MSAYIFLWNLKTGLEESQTSSYMTSPILRSVNIDTFKKRMYDWASSMTSSGRNMPFSLPLRTRQTAEGFEVLLLRHSFAVDV